jgi:hypothetical protein
MIGHHFSISAFWKACNASAQHACAVRDVGAGARGYHRRPRVDDVRRFHVRHARCHGWHGARHGDIAHQAQLALGSLGNDISKAKPALRETHEVVTEAATRQAPSH